MSFHLDMKVLREEHRLMEEVMKIIKDQLNRLKVEELALKSSIRLCQEEEEPAECESSDDVTQGMEDDATINTLPLNLGVNAQGYKEEEEEEEEDDDDEDEDNPDSSYIQLEFLNELNKSNLL